MNIREIACGGAHLRNISGNEKPVSTRSFHKVTGLRPSRLSGRYSASVRIKAALLRTCRRGGDVIYLVQSMQKQLHCKSQAAIIENRFSFSMSVSASTRSGLRPSGFNGLLGRYSASVGINPALLRTCRQGGDVSDLVQSVSTQESICSQKPGSHLQM
jgi:hypothetical protein